ncbi:MAG: hypothetical protein IT580_14195, partial [Verrucomicrobiales bacterium]|nr:hypothetical protein [Verrucomicrobiales bacterium]
QPDPSLVLIRPHQRPDPARPESWRSSRFVLGSPGGTDTLEFTGAPGADLNANGVPDLVDHVFGPNGPATAFQLSTNAMHVSYTWMPAAENAGAIVLEQAFDVLGPWQPVTLTAAPGDREGLPAGQERRHLTVPLPADPSTPWFLRLAVNPFLSPPGAQLGEQR